MSLTFDQNGVQTSTFSEIQQGLDAGYRGIYGTDIILDQESPDGQRVGIETTLRFDVESAFAWLYSQLDPDFNTGDMQQIIGKLSGTYLLPSSRSQWDLTITTDRNVTLPSGYTVTDNNNQNWFIDSDIALTTGSTAVTFLSSLWGDINGIASGSSFTQATPELGVVSISALGDALTGREEETEEAFRLRRQASTENPSQSTVGAIFAKLAQLNGVTDLEVLDNSTNTYDSDKDLGPNTMWCIIEGGSLDKIGETIAKQRLGNTKGDITVTYTDGLVKPDGTPFFLVNDHKIDRPDYVDLYIRLNATQKVSGSPVDVTAIENQLEKHKVFINQNLQAGELYDSAYINNYNYIVSDLEVSLDGLVWTSGEVFSGYGGKFSISAANITVTEIPV